MIKHTKKFPIEIGDYVMLFTPRTELGLTTKFLFKVLVRVNPVNYRLENDAHPVHVQRLRPYWNRLTHITTITPRYYPYSDRRPTKWFRDTMI